MFSVHQGGKDEDLIDVAKIRTMADLAMIIGLDHVEGPMDLGETVMSLAILLSRTGAGDLEIIYGLLLGVCRFANENKVDSQTLAGAIKMIMKIVEED